MAVSIETRVAKLEEKGKNCELRLQKLEEIQGSINTISIDMKELSLTQKQMLETMKAEQEIRKQHDERLTSLEMKPARNWDKLIWLIVSALVSGLAGWLLGHFLQ